MRRRCWCSSASFSSYFIFALPSGKLVEWRGYKGTMVIGLLVMAAWRFLFLPASAAASFGLFLSALVILAAGITTLQVAANPYVANLGPPETSAARLNLSQAFNSFGTFVAPFFGSMFILASVPLAPEKLKSFSAAALQAVPDGAGFECTRALSGNWADAGAAGDLVCGTEAADDGLHARHSPGRAGCECDERQHLEASGAAGRSAGDLCLCGRGGF